MQKRVLSSAIALALTSGAALAQSSVTIYGNLDVSFDRIKKDAGTTDLTSALIAGGVPSSSAPAVNATLNGAQSFARVGPDMSSQSSLGFKGVEDLGGGYKGNFVLEGQIAIDSGTLLRDGRLFGRQAFVGVTSPYGELRLGRQYAPIFFSTALITTERFGGTDQFVEGGMTNSLNIRWDNAVTYSAQVNGFRGQLGYSPNAGVADYVNANRGSAGSDTAGSILGGNNSGASSEKTSGRGRSYGAFGAYSLDALTMSLGYGATSFKNVNVGLLTLPSSLTLFQLGDYRVWNLGAKYVLKDTGLTFNGTFGRATYDISGIGSTVPSTLSRTLFGLDNGTLAVSSLVLGTRYDTGAMGFLAQWSEIKFRNDGHGKDHGITLGAEYSLSKRTTLYSRYAQVKDIGTGPAVVFAATGIREVPSLGLSVAPAPDGKVSMVGIGVRHSF
jgi:predicted porin